MRDMDLNDLFGGESDCIEYKVARPKDAKKYLRTVVAFANGHGGCLVFGVDDKSREVVGIADEEVPQEMDAIANAIGDACAPTIVPSIYARTVDGKSVIVVEVAAGQQVPYYLKSLGLERGVYTRVGATSRPADLDYAREIMVENSPRGFDRMPNRDVELTEAGVEALCARMRDVALENSRDERERRAVKPVTKNQLIKWGVILEREGELLPTNAYALLTGEGYEFAWRVQCGVFRGTGRSVFLDRREFDGSVVDQVEQAYQYVLSKINMGANFDQLVRRDEYEIPMWPIRELITNAILHRSYLISSCVQVCLFDDRLEISSPGGLKRGLTLQKALDGRSEIRNHALAQAFHYMRLIENWGTGLRRARDQIVAFGLREPEFLVDDEDFRVNVYRMSLDEFGKRLDPLHGNRNAVGDGSTVEENSAINRRLATIGDKSAINRRLAAIGGEKRAREVLSMLYDTPSITTREVGVKLGLKPSRARDVLAALVDAGLLERRGSNRNAHYVLPN